MNALPTKKEIIEALADALEQHAANTNTPDKVTAWKLDCSVVAIKQARQKRNAPSLHQFVKMYIHIPEVQIAFAKLTAEAALAQEASDYQLELDRMVRSFVTGKPSAAFLRAGYEPD